MKKRDSEQLYGLGDAEEGRRATGEGEGGENRRESSLITVPLPACHCLLSPRKRPPREDRRGTSTTVISRSDGRRVYARVKPENARITEAAKGNRTHCSPYIIGRKEQLCLPGAIYTVEIYAHESKLGSKNNKDSRTAVFHKIIQARVCTSEEETSGCNVKRGRDVM